MYLPPHGEEMNNELNDFCTWLDCSLTQDCYLTGAWKMPEICSPPPTPATLQSCVQGTAVLWSVTPDLLHLLWCCMKTLMWDKRKRVPFGPMRSAGSGVILFTGALYPWLSFVSGSIRAGLCALSDAERRLSSEGLLAASHQHVSSLWLSLVGKKRKSSRKTSAGGFMRQSLRSGTLSFMSQLRWDASGGLGQIHKTVVFSTVLNNFQPNRTFSSGVANSNS